MLWRFIKYFLLFFFIAVLFLVAYLFLTPAKEAENISWGVDFSQKHAQNLGLDWKKTYLALLDDLGARNIKIDTYWDFIEWRDGEYRFDDLDWQVQEAERRGVSIILVMGMKTPRWPECHMPDWAKKLTKEQQQEKILALLKTIVSRYKEDRAIWAWQVENEPFFAFGECPWSDKKFLSTEVELVKSLDFQNRPIIISDSGEWSLWLKAAMAGDMVGTTLYRKVWLKPWGIYYSNLLPANFYGNRAKIINKIFKKNVICVELQSEPWGPKLLYDLPLEEQEETMNLDIFKSNIEFAKKTGLNKFYLWGGEWWYWMKESKNKPEIWNEVKKLFNQQ